MIIGIGIDILEKTRIKNTIKKYNTSFAKKILNKKELSIYKKTKKKITTLSKIFSLKESFVKALGTGFKKTISFRKIIIRHTKLGKPVIKNKKTQIYTSISHENNIVISILIIKIKN